MLDMPARVDMPFDSIIMPFDSMSLVFRSSFDSSLS